MHLVQHLRPRSPSHRAAVGVIAVVEVPSSDGTRTYQVAHMSDGRWACDPDCKGFAYRETCRHIPLAKAQEVTL